MVCSRCSDDLKGETLGQTNPRPSTSDLVFTQLITDTIEVVKHLNGRYLWVDRYCINQHDEVEKRDQIRNMHHIYEDAVATIVPIDAHCAHDGIPGVSTGRVPQLEVFVEPCTLTLSLPHIRTVASRSIWEDAWLGPTRSLYYLVAVCSFQRSRCIIFVVQHRVPKTSISSLKPPLISEAEWLSSTLILCMLASWRDAVRKTCRRMDFVISTSTLLDLKLAISPKNQIPCSHWKDSYQN